MTRLWLKDDGRNPTASFKDRASAVVVARAQEIGAGTVVTASTGNAGAALAGMAAAAGQPAVILAPRTAPPAKVAQLLIFGATVLLVDGSYDQAFDLTVEAAAALGWYCRNTGYNLRPGERQPPSDLRTAGSRAQAGAGRNTASRAGDFPLQWISPDVVVVSVSDAYHLGMHKGSGPRRPGGSRRLRG
jgi:threonine synthase